MPEPEGCDMIRTMNRAYQSRMASSQGPDAGRSAGGAAIALMWSHSLSRLLEINQIGLEGWHYGIACLVVSLVACVERDPAHGPDLHGHSVSVAPVGRLI
jgi:hypothetical protein